MNVIALEKKYGASFNDHFSSLELLFKELTELSNIDFENQEISKAILIRLHSWYTWQNRIKKLLNKRYMPPGSDFFVETILFYLQTIFSIYNIDLEIHSERLVKSKNESIRPDISIWDGDSVLAIIECKTQLGWNREGWKKAFAERQQKIKRLFSQARVFLVVMSSVNWSGFGEDRRVGKNLFALYNVWPSEVDFDTKLDRYINNPIEPLIKSILTLKNHGNIR